MPAPRPQPSRREPPTPDQHRCPYHRAPPHRRAQRPCRRETRSAERRQRQVHGPRRSPELPDRGNRSPDRLPHHRRPSRKAIRWGHARDHRLRRPGVVPTAPSGSAGEFAQADVDRRHLLIDRPDEPDEVADLTVAALSRGVLGDNAKTHGEPGSTRKQDAVVTAVPGAVSSRRPPASRCGSKDVPRGSPTDVPVEGSTCGPAQRCVGSDADNGDGHLHRYNSYMAITIVAGKIR
jgi:hypothetical protein